MKGCLFFIFLLYASVSDLKTHKVNDVVHICILIISLIGIEKMPLLSMVCGLFLVPLPLLIAAMIKPGAIGGADIKLMGACGFFLGFSKGITALILGLTIGVIFMAIIQHRNEKKAFALVPYLSIASLIAYLI